MLAYFGKSFIYKLYLLQEDELDYKNLPEAPKSIYLYDKKPTLEEAKTGTGKLAIIIPSVWSNTIDSYGKQIEIPAVIDPNPTSEEYSECDYYIVINLELETGVEQSPLRRLIRLQRLKAQHSIIDVSLDDLFVADPELENACQCKGNLERYIMSATLEVKDDVAMCDFRKHLTYGNVWNPKRLNRAVALLAVSKYWKSQSLNTNDIYSAKGVDYAEQYKKMIRKITLEYDADNNGTPDKKVNRSCYQRIRLVT